MMNVTGVPLARFEFTKPDQNANLNPEAGQARRIEVKSSAPVGVRARRVLIQTPVALRECFPGGSHVNLMADGANHGISW